jgi:hypothetical protein
MEYIKGERFNNYENVAICAWRVNFVDPQLWRNIALALFHERNVFFF